MSERVASERSRLHPKAVVLALLAIYVIVLALVNSERVRLDFLILSPSPKAIVRTVR